MSPADEIHAILKALAKKKVEDELQTEAGKSSMDASTMIAKLTGMAEPTQESMVEALEKEPRLWIAAIIEYLDRKER